MGAVNINTFHEKKYTLKDIDALPDGQRAELIDGQIYYMEPPGLAHQRIVSYLHSKIYSYIERNAGSCEVLPAPFAVFLNDEDDTTYLEPDISVVCDRGKLDEKGCHGAPDWVIEVVSASSRPRDYIRKMVKYNMAGVREYWIVDPEKEITTVYQFDKETMEQYAFGNEVPVGIYEHFSIKVEHVYRI